MMNLEQNACATQNCNHFQSLIQKSLTATGWGMMIQSTRFFPERRIDSPPDLVVLRVSQPELFSRVAEYIRKRWERALILGLFCHETEVDMPLPETLTSRLDDYLACPFEAADVAPRIMSLLSQAKRSRVETVSSPHREDPSEDDPSSPVADLFSKELHPLFGKSPCFLTAMNKIPQLAQSDANLLLLGETGTGKELFARAIHNIGPRREKAFVPLNCGAIPDHLFENELFGHEKGAFTDASSFEKGVLTEAEGGTLLLDEIDALSPAAQVKLLRFLQDREYRPLGQSKSRLADVRIIAASNKNLMCEMKASRFREDVFYRLNLLSLSLPSLRERIDDIPPLARYFLSRYTTKYGRPPLYFSPEAIQKLLTYPWPGNVRELEALIHRAVVMSEAATIGADAIELPTCHENTSTKRVFREAKLTAIAQFEHAYLIDLLAQHRGNVSQAAKACGTDRRALQRLIRKYDLNPRTF